MALVHTIDNKVEAAYRRGDLLAKRADLMQDWAEFVNTSKKLRKSPFQHFKLYAISYHKKSREKISLKFDKDIFSRMRTPSNLFKPIRNIQPFL